MTPATILFITAAAAPDSIPCLVYQRLDSAPRYVMAVAVMPAPAEILAAANTLDFRRNTGHGKDPYDGSAALNGYLLQVAARLDGPAWETCAVYAGDVLVGWFRRVAELGSERRPGGARIEDGVR